jgi:hypothetical protein
MPQAARVQVSIDPDVVRHAVAGHVAAIVAATVQFLLLNPRTWVSQRLTDAERADVERVVAKLMHAGALDDPSCPLCAMTQCETDCPLALARDLVRRQ